MAKPKTHNTFGTKMGDFLVGGRLLLPSELPTERDVLRLAVCLQEENMLVREEESRNYPMRDVVSDVLQQLLGKWQMANPLFQSPIIIS